MEVAVRLTTRMLENCPATILQAMLGHRPSIAIFGSNHVLTGARVEGR